MTDLKMGERPEQKARHYVTDVDAATSTGTCRVCGPCSPMTWRARQGNWACSHARREQHRKSEQKRNRAPEYLRNRALAKKYDMTPEDYSSILAAQSNVCAICQQPCRTGRQLAVDHDHISGAVRGLLCNRCNRGLGLFADSEALMRRALQYLTATRT